jgi:CTD kinase subunit beta
MVFVAWDEYGICKWHMLQRCFEGDRCTWKHPAPRERSDLWEYHKAKQQYEWDEYGIPPPRNPYKEASSAGAVVAPPPVLPSRSGGVTTTSPNPPREVSMLDAPPSPKNMPTRSLEMSQPRGNANKEPLGRPNRFQNVFDGIAQEPENQGKSTSGGQVDLSVLFANIPSTQAVSVWKRPDNVDTDTQMTQNEDTAQKVGGYWERKKEYDARKKQDEVEEKSKQEMPPPPLPSKALPTSAPPLKPAYGTPFKPTSNMGATKRLSNGEAKPIGPHPSTIKVSAPYLSQAAIDKRLQPSQPNGQFEVQERSNAEAREDSMRLQGVTWIDNVRRALSLPIRTYSTACVYYHKFRLANPGILTGMEYGNAWADACAASLLMACKNEDTLKKSKDILAAAYNLKATGHDQLGSDDPVFEGPSKAVIGLERMVLEAGGFDFRSKHPHKLFVKIAKSMPEGEDGERQKVEKVGWSIMTDMYRTFAPLKQTTATMALAGLELAAHLHATSSANNTSAIRDELRIYDISKWSTTREQIMETLLDLLDLYTQHTAQTILGTQHSLEDFIRIRLFLNKECNESSLPRYTLAPSPERVTNGSTLQVANGHPTPVSPPQPETQTQAQAQTSNQPPVPEGGGTLRFMLNPQLASDEKVEVQKYFTEEWEEYEEEIEVPIPRAGSRDRERDNRRPSLDRPMDGARNERPMDERFNERDRPRRRFDDRRYDDRRFDDRRPDRRYDDRRFDDNRRRRP